MDDDDEDDSVDQEPPYQSLASSSGMKRYGTLASLELLDDSEQVAEDSTDSEDHCEWDSDIDEGDRNKKQGESCEYCSLSRFCLNAKNNKYKFMSAARLHLIYALFAHMRYSDINCVHVFIEM
jgi:hypothetical protein